MNMLSRSKGKKSARPETPNVFVDLSKEDVPGDMTILKIRTIRPLFPAELDNVIRAIQSKSTVLVDLESFTGDRAAFIESLKAGAHENSARTYALNSISIIIAPQGVEVRNQSIRRN